MGSPSETEQDGVHTHRRPISLVWIRQNRRRRVFLGVAAVFTLLLCYGNLLSAIGFGATPFTSEEPGSQKDFDWFSMKSREDLHYEPCYGNFQCARLKLPLDWKNPSDGSISLAVIRLPAPVPVHDPRHGGAILTNPGGPGGSGVGLVLVAGLALQHVVSTTSSNSSAEKYFDIISFDPRGVGFSSPIPTCFKGNAARRSFLLRFREEGIPGSSDVSLANLWAMMKAEGGACDTSDDKNIKRYMTTASVARDMVALVDKDAAWRSGESESARTPNSLIRRMATSVFSKSRTSAATSSSDSDKAKLQYWGFSYGTLLGGTFASMFPDRVGKVILDGNVDFEDYYSTRWGGNLVDTEATMRSFYETCAASGPEICKLAEENSTPADIEIKVRSVLNALKIQPMAAPNHGRPEIITYTDLKQLIFQSLYQPVREFPGLASIVAELLEGKTDTFAELLHEENTLRCNETDVTDSLERYAEASQTIMCTDGEDVSGDTIRDAEQYWRELEAVSPTAGGIWSVIRLGCNNWPIRPAWRFTGPYGANKTANPLLLIGNTADPVTPLVNTMSMAKRFPSSRALTQNSPGHCSIAAVSFCSIDYIKKYFYDGTLPDEGTVCEPDQKPFGPAMAGMNAENLQLYTAHETLARTFAKGRFGLGQGRYTRVSGISA